MKRENVNRRDFNKLTVAAMGGMVAGSFVGCGGGSKSDKSGEGVSNKTGTSKDPALAAWTGEHACRGLNSCKGEGKGRNNECAGRGECATVEPHECAGHNTCKNLGGCGETAGSNECKGQGNCHVPLMDSAWQTAYKKFKEDMTKAGMAGKLPEPPGPPK
jgi:hypothetical protein